MTADVIPTEPDFRQWSWRSAPGLWEQALEAARDDPTTAEFARLLDSLPDVLVVDVLDEEYHPTVVTVDCEQVSETRTDDLLTIARRAGWKADDINWQHHRLYFVIRGEADV